MRAFYLIATVAFGACVVFGCETYKDCVKRFVKDGVVNASATVPKAQSCLQQTQANMTGPELDRAVDGTFGHVRNLEVLALMYNLWDPLIDCLDESDLTADQVNTVYDRIEDFREAAMADGTGCLELP